MNASAFSAGTGRLGTHSMLCPPRGKAMPPRGVCRARLCLSLAAVRWQEERKGAKKSVASAPRHHAGWPNCPDTMRLSPIDLPRTISASPVCTELSSALATRR